MERDEAEPGNVAIARQYLAAIEQRVDGATLARFFHPDAVQEEFPNRLTPNGARRDLAALLAGQERGKQILAAERYEIVAALASGDHVALEVRWSGTLGIALGESLPAGFIMRARFAVFLEFSEGRITAQRNYDCFDPW